MYQKVLIASDPEGLAEQTVTVVAALVGGADARVRVVAVEEEVAPADVRRRTAEHLDRIVTDLRNRGLTAERTMRHAHRGHVADHLASAAGDWGADLIVLGSHRRGDLRSLFVGSVGHALAARTRTPLLFVGSDRPVAGSDRSPAGGRRVLVAIDYDKESQQAIKTAIEISGPDTRVHVIHVQTLPGATTIDGYVPDDLVEAVQREGHYMVEGALQQFADHGIRATWEIFEPPGEVAHVIARTADYFDADVIVLGSRRLHTAWALIAGSVAHDVIASTRRAVLLAGAQPETSTTGPTVGAANQTGGS